MQMFNYIFTILFLFSTLTLADVSGTSIKGATPNTYLLEGFNEVASSAGTTTLTKDSQTKQILTGTTTQTYVLPSATTIPLSRKFLFINKSTGLMTIQTNGGGALTTVSAGSQKEVHLRAAGSAAGTWDVLNTGGVWGSISGTLGAQTDLQAALDTKPDKSTLTTKGDIYAATGSGVVTRLGVSGNNGYVLTEDSAEPTGFKWAASSGGGGGVWGGITGVLSNQTDLQAALDLKAPLASPTFSGTITTPLTANRALVTGASGVLSASATTDTQIGYLSTLSSNAQTQLDAKQARSTLTTKGDLYVATASATVARQGVGSNGQVLMSDSTQTNGVKWTTPTSENLIFDGNAESGITNFVEGSYSAATRPSGTFTPSSGAGTFQISTTSTDPIFGSNSLLLTKSSGASRQGRAIERTINLDSGYRTKMLKTRIDYTIVSGSFVAGSNGSSPTDSSLIWYVGQYNGSAWTYTEPSTFKMFSNSTTNKDWVEGEFQVNADTTQLKLIGFISESANSAWVVKAEVGFRLSAYLAGTTTTDWVSYTPTGGWTGAVSYSGKWRRVGDSAEYAVTVTTSGAPTGTTLSVNLPSGQSIDTTKLNTTTSDVIHVGTTKVLDSGVQEYGIGYVKYTSPTSVTAMASNASTTYLASAGLTPTVPITFGTGDTVDIRFAVPIQGWASSTQQSDGYDGREISAHLALASDYTPAANAVLKYDTVVYDKTSSYSTSTGLYTIPSPGRYRIGVFGVTTSASGNLLVYKNGTANKYVATVVAASRGFYGGTTIDCVAGDTIGIYSDSNVLYSGNVKYNYFTIEKVASPQTISATEVVALNVYGAAPNSSLTGSASDVTWNSSSVEDTHGAFVKSTGVWTVPAFGFYDLSAAIRTGGTFAAANLVQLYVVINGTTKYGNILQATSASNTEISPTLNIKSIRLNAGDTVKLQALSAATSPTYLSTTSNSYFSISRVK